jgi:hypothetical protein
MFELIKGKKKYIAHDRESNKIRPVNLTTVEEISEFVG